MTREPEDLEAAFGEVADHLSEATLSLEQLDYNVLLEDELWTVLEAHAMLSDLCSQYRSMQQSRRRSTESES